MTPAVTVGLDEIAALTRGSTAKSRGHCINFGGEQERKQMKRVHESFDEPEIVDLSCL